MIRYLGGNTCEFRKLQKEYVYVQEEPIATQDHLDVILSPKLQFEGIFQGREKEIRITEDKRISVFDFIKVVGGQANPKQTWANIQKNHKEEVVQFLDYSQFGKTKATPVINVQGMVKLLFWLPGELAKQFRSKSAEVMIRYLGGDTSLIDEFKKLQEEFTQEELIPEIKLISQESLVIKQFQDFNITVYGTYEEPLFKAKDIGDLLGIQKIRNTIENLDDQCKVMKVAHTGGGLQDQWFLTEDGIYEILCISRKPIAKQFRIKVREILKEIRLTGKYETQKNIEAHTKSNLLIEQNKDKSINYLGIVEENPEYTIAKYGHTKYAKDTLSRHKETYGENFHFIHMLECERNHDLEKMIQTHNDLIKRHVKEYQGKKRQELLRLDKHFSIKDLIDLMKSLKESMESKYDKEIELAKEHTKQKELELEIKKMEYEMMKLQYSITDKTNN